ETKKNLNKKNVQEMAKVIYDSERVFVYATGVTQKGIAKEMQRTFLVSRKYFYVIEGETELETVLSDVTSKDLLIIITLNGDRDFLNRIVNSLNINGIKYISMTKFSDNVVARNTHYNLYISSTIINAGKDQVHESIALFFLLVDILFREYLIYAENQSMIKDGNSDEDEVTDK
ncbi:MAG TPA: SIS domain-containing protein, partial [Clostridium sp.]